jgi:hypothetical protein
MKTLLQPIREYVRTLRATLVGGWNRFWFTPSDPTTLATIRIVTGLVLLYVHVTCLADLLNFVGPNAWVDQEAIVKIRTEATVPSVLFEGKVHRNYWGQSVWFYVRNPTAIWAIHGVFLLAIVCFTLGLGSRVAAVLVWLGHLSYLHRGLMIWFGMDTILAMLTFYLMFAPVGATLSLDRAIGRYRAARRTLRMSGRPDTVPLATAPHWSVTVVIRLIQVHMCIIYFAAGAAKLQGPTWWSGTATWMTMMLPEFALFDMSWLARLGEWPVQYVSALGNLFTILFELSFAFLIWHRLWRPFVLFMAVLLHASIGIFMGLGGFGVVMLTGCLAFVAPASVSWLLEHLFKGRSGYRFVYDRQDSRQVAAASWIYAADSWKQVQVVEIHDRSVGEPGGTLVTPNGKHAQGLSAFGKLFGALRALWILWPAAVWAFLRLPRTVATVRQEDTAQEEARPVSA